jgi:hypothetical protein
LTSEREARKRKSAGLRRIERSVLSLSFNGSLIPILIPICLCFFLSFSPSRARALIPDDTAVTL